MTEGKTNSGSTESQKFDAGVRKILSVSHDELLKREQEWKRKRATKAKPGPKPRRSDGVSISGK